MIWLALAKLLTYLGLSLLLGGSVMRRTRLADLPLWWLGLGAGLVLAGGLLEVGSTLIDLGFTAPSDVADFLTTTRTGRAAIVRVIGAALLLASGLQGWWLLSLGAGVLTLWGAASAGHSGELGGVWLLLDMVHAGAAAIWVGGVLALASRRPSLETGRRFTAVALSCIGVLVVSGVVATLRHVPLASLWSALWGSTWGMALLIKLGLLVTVVPMSVLVRRALTTGWLAPLLLESALLTGVLGVSGALATSPPPSLALIQRQVVPVSVKLGGQIVSGQLVLSGPGDLALTLTPALPNLRARLIMLDHAMPNQSLVLSNVGGAMSAQTQLWMSGNWALELSQGVERARVKFGY
ncbi:hypothetical protein GCM10022631_13830 [Deinococcus rubellus]|uniref:Copper resistance protein D domain-containing protein n=1 Tax=Deinococcus rubellus TaxID=1889240 RepID=A0ABY5YE97_9DEIO|nr:hypothetical protein [Deinococcus rubellus]UWX63395.1 hypothetical protein N0D28_11650 [Deinococcus rubellus]